jgi:NAD(P) transhydrogenase
MLIVDKGEVISPYEPPPSAPKPAAGAAIVSKEVEDPQTAMMNDSIMYTGLLAGGLGLGSCMPDAGMLATLALSVWVGSQSVKSVAHALHSPLMSITNAISGMTIIGGMLQMGGGIVPYSMPQALATTAVALSAVNISGGFLVTNKMLDMFRRPTDPPEYWHYYLAPAGVATAGFATAVASGACPANLTPAVGLASGLTCVGAIASMSDQSTSRAAPTLAAAGIGMGFATALASMNVSPAVIGQLALFGGAGAYAGRHIANQVGPTELPQAVAGFHSLVGIAATATAVGDFMTHDLAHLDGFHLSSIYGGSWMGAITATGSVIAWGKLSERLDSKPLALPGRDYMNLGMAAASVGGMYGFVTTKDPSTAATCLGLGTASSSLLGLHMTASIGGADMPVVITLLNSYSGWALCAEGFILDAPVLTVVGALIGSSGALLTKIMCDGMNRSLPNVILGGFGMEAGVVQTNEGLVHTEINSEESALALMDAERVLIVPGYGMAVGQAQGVTAEITKVLTDQGKVVNFAVHPVAGRMPGQLNVLLAEAGVPYDQVHEMEDINAEMSDYDVTMVIGANDTVNSNAEDDPNCDIAGMPVIRGN